MNANAPKLVTLLCPSCGGKLQITQDIERFACGYCGVECVVKRGGGIISIAPIVDEIKKVQTGVDKTAAELAIARIRIEIEELESSYSLEKSQVLYSKVEKEGIRAPYVAAFIINLYNFKYRILLSAFKLKENVQKFTSLSDEEIIYSLENWEAIFRFQTQNREYKSLHDGLSSIRQLMQRKNQAIHEKQMQLEKLLQITNSNRIGA